MRRLLLVSAVLAAPAAIVSLVPYQAFPLDGSRELSVTIVSASGSPIVYADCEPGGPDEAWLRTRLEAHFPPEMVRPGTVQDPFRGEPLDFRVDVTWRVHAALLWETAAYHQPKHLNVVVRYRDGRWAGKWVELPDLRQTRVLRVEVP